MSTPTTTDAESLIENLDRRGPMHHFHHAVHKYPWISPAIVLLAGSFYVLSLLLGRRDSLLARQLSQRTHRKA